MKKLSETRRIARGALIAFLMVIAAVSSYGRTVSVISVEKDLGWSRWANLQFTAGDPAVLHVAWGTADGGTDIDAWEHHRPVAMIDGSVTAYRYTFPEDMGDDVAAVRFFLLEDYDIPLTKRYAYIETDGTQYVETSFVPSGRSAVEMQLSLNKVDSSVALCCARKDSMNSDSFTAFYITGSGWRFDYYDGGSAVGPVAEVNKPYALRLEGDGIYLDGSCISARTPVQTVSGRSLLLFGAKYGNAPLDAEYRANLKLYSMKAWRDSTDQTSIDMDLIPTELDGEPCLYNRIDGTYMKSARSGYPLAHGEEVPVNRPAVVASTASVDVSGIWHFDGRAMRVSSMEKNSDGSKFANLQFTAGDPAVLYVAWGTADGGSDIDAWEHNRPVAMIGGSVTAYRYTFPEDMGDDVAAVRFFLLEDYDIPLTKRYAYIETDGSQYVETSFIPSGHSAVEMQLSLNKVDSSVALCCARTDNSNSFTVFYITGSGWRFDYYDGGSAVGPVAEVNKPYALRLEGSGMYLDGSCISAYTPVPTVSGRSLLLFGAKYGNEPQDAQYKASMKLYSMKAWRDSADANSIALDLIPTEHEGEACLYNKIDGTFLKSAISGCPLAHGEEVSVNRPAVLSSSISLNVSGTWYVDCVNGNDTNLGTSALPKQTIRAATTYALSGDIIYVAPGTYGEMEGSQLATATAKTGARVLIPEGVTIESTGGVKETFIVGAAAEGENIDNVTFGTGTNAVRCVYAMNGSTLRGFTLTGGRGIGTGEAWGDGRGSAFYSATVRGAVVEDCIISNNVAHSATINQAVVRNCHVIGNTGTIANNGISGSAGYSCSWYNCIIAKNIGTATVFGPNVFESCTLGFGNKMSDGGSAQVLYWWDGNNHAINNCAVLYGRYYCVSPGKIILKNCLVMAADVDSCIDVGVSYNTIFTNSTAAQVDSDYRPVFGSFAGIDAGDTAYSSEELGYTDIYYTPRILNAALDIGAVEYDWRTTFAAELGRRFTMTYASPTVTTNETGGLKLDGNVGTLGESTLPMCVAGTATSAGLYAFTFELSGGSAQVYVGDVLAGETSVPGEQMIRFNVPDASTEIRFIFTPDELNSSAVILRKFSGARGFVIRLR